MLKKRSKGIILLVNLITLLILMGCNNEKHQSNHSIRVISQINEHSSIEYNNDGIPLLVSVIGNDGKNIDETFEYIISTSYGSIIAMEEIKKIEYKAIRYSKSYKSVSKILKVFWISIDEDGSRVPDNINEIILSIKVYNQDGYIQDSKQVKLLRKDKSYFRLKDDNNYIFYKS